jgi:hypothetical protein
MALVARGIGGVARERLVVAAEEGNGSAEGLQVVAAPAAGARVNEHVGVAAPRALSLRERVRVRGLGSGAWRVLGALTPALSRRERERWRISVMPLAWAWSVTARMPRGNRSLSGSQVPTFGQPSPQGYQPASIHQ